jgi:hypothetical protein
MLKKARLIRIEKTEANDFMKKYEHLGDVGLGVWHWGLILRGKLISVVSYGTTCFSNNRGWISRIAKEVGFGVIQLCRGATIPNAPKGAPSRLIGLSNKEMYKRRGSVLIVAYADQKLCEIGTIYQACNSVYTGMTDPKGQANYILHGERMSGWKVRKQFGTRDRKELIHIDPNCKVLPLRKRHRYIMISAPPLKKRYMQKLLSPYSLPYPSRSESGIGSMAN